MRTLPAAPFAALARWPVMLLLRLACMTMILGLTLRVQAGAAEARAQAAAEIRAPVRVGIGQAPPDAAAGERRIVDRPCRATDTPAARQDAGQPKPAPAPPCRMRLVEMI